MRFDQGATPASELAFTAETNQGAWPNRPSYTRVRAAGCYAYQVDSARFSEVIVFEAQPAS
jgi:hypothetical protein